MDSELISKKELLDLTGISYGQLYRWKRKNLIPEEWFIRKSAFTGQETFFPKQDILVRIDKIKNMKDDLSLDELAGMFSPLPAAGAFAKDELVKRNIVSVIALQLYEQVFPTAPEYGFVPILYMFVIDQWLQSGELGLEEGKSVLKLLQAHLPEGGQAQEEILLVRKMGISIALLHDGASELRTEPGAKIVLRTTLARCMEELKLKLN